MLSEFARDPQLVYCAHLTKCLLSLLSTVPIWPNVYWADTLFHAPWSKLGMLRWMWAGLMARGEFYWAATSEGEGTSGAGGMTSGVVKNEREGEIPIWEGWIGVKKDEDKDKKVHWVLQCGSHWWLHRARGSGMAEEQNRPQCASFDEILGILTTLFYGRFVGSVCLHSKQKVTQNGGPCSLDPPGSADRPHCGLSNLETL